MQALAQYIMRGRRQATLVTVVTAAVPMLFWLSAAAGSLVILRRGPQDGLKVLAWALAPALVWWFLGDPRTLLVIAGAALLALLLRRQLAWRVVLLYSLGLGVLYALAVSVLFSDAIQALAEELSKALPQALPEFWNELSAEQQNYFLALFVAMMTSLLGALLQVLAVISLMLGRYWQAALYNAGGFGREFRELRFSPFVALSLLTLVLSAPSFGTLAVLLVLPCSVPLAFAGIALVHGLVAQGRLTRFWLVGLYVALVLFLQFIYPLLAVLAVLDSLFDFRGRALPDKRQGPTDGEG